MTAKSTQDVLNALEGLKAGLQRRKVTVNSNAEDVAPLQASHLRRGEANFKNIDQPISTYAAKSTYKVMKDGKMVGMSMFAGYSYNEHMQLLLRWVDADAVEMTCIRWFGVKNTPAPRKSRLNRTNKPKLRCASPRYPIRLRPAKTTPIAGAADIVITKGCRAFLPWPAHSLSEAC